MARRLARRCPTPARAEAGGDGGSPPVRPRRVAPRRRATGRDDSGPATQAQLKSLRRWLLVAAVWATAATVIAVLAFLAANNDEEQRLAETQR